MLVLFLINIVASQMQRMKSFDPFPLIQIQTISTIFCSEYKTMLCYFFVSTRRAVHQLLEKKHHVNAVSSP